MKNLDLLTDSYDYELDPKRIAQRPVSPRDHSKLLVYDQKSDQIQHKHFYDLPEILSPGDQLVFNRSKVFPCRLSVKKPTGGKAELFLLSLHPVDGCYPAMIRSNGKKKVGDRFELGEIHFELTGLGAEGEFYLKSSHSNLGEFLYQQAQVPIPPYIRGGDADEQDLQDYQTVYAQDEGSVAAPTAGLHFTENLLQVLDQKSIERSYVTLHVGMGTFKPVASDNILEHKMHTESFLVDPTNLEKIKNNPRRFAVGTTSLRVLESIYQNGKFEPASGETDIFLYPGVEVKSIAGLITNFHLPKSTLLMLVSALIGREKTLELYRIAVNNDYRFYSYGDAMIILRDQ